MEKWHNYVAMYEKRIVEDGIVVIEDITEMPVYDEDFVSPHFVICINNSGSVELDYDTLHPRKFNEHDIAIVYPRHLFVPHKASGDYNSTLVVMSQKMYENQANHHVTIKRLHYETSPSFHLDDGQYEAVMHTVKVLKSICDLRSESASELKVVMFNVLVKMLDVYRNENDGGKVKPVKSLGSLFYEVLSKNCIKERNVDFYAKHFSLSTKHFSRMIDRETGHPVGYWIRKCVIAESKQMIRNEHSLTLQEISNRLDFPDQASFSRYFKRETGMTPSEYRWKINH